MNSTRVNSPSNSRISRLEVSGFRTRIHLGCSAEERALAQEVEFDLQLRFREEPVAAQTDRLEGTICYASLCEIIDRTARAHPFQLIEALGREVYEALHQATLKQDVRLQLTVHKLRTPVENLRGGARFVYGDALT